MVTFYDKFDCKIVYYFSNNPIQILEQWFPTWAQGPTSGLETNFLNEPRVGPMELNLLQIEKRRGLHMKLNQGLQVQLDNLKDRHLEQCSH